ncbi:hypothetical protein QL093DRAFT_2537701 [Fusarium oxysporum]|nr:hypothetical protein QL093DRAFT_2537701 [Fusarium oxysporum]
MVGTGVVHKIISILLRLGETASAIIVLGILSHFCYLISIAEDMFLGFPFDFVMFVMWLVAYCLLQTRTGDHTCSARCCYDYWGYYWGRFWRVGPIGTVTINGAGCGSWKTVLAFSFIAWFLHLLSSILGIYVFRIYIKIEETKREIKHQAEKLATGDSRVHSCSQRAEGENRMTDNV